MPFSKTNESNSWSVGPNKASYWYSVRLGHRVYVFGFSTFCTIDYLYRIICRLFVPRTVHITDYSYHTPFIPDFSYHWLFIPYTVFWPTAPWHTVSRFAWTCVAKTNWKFDE